MPRAKRNYKLIRTLACQNWIEGEEDLQKLADTYNVGVRTIEKWKREDGWQNREVTLVELRAKVEQLLLEASIKALEDYVANPTNQEKQSLVLLMKQFQKELSPAKELNAYIIKFLEQVIDFCIEKGFDELREQMQEHGHELCEYLRTRNNG